MDTLSQWNFISGTTLNYGACILGFLISLYVNWTTSNRQDYCAFDKVRMIDLSVVIEREMRVIKV